MHFRFVPGRRAAWLAAAGFLWCGVSVYAQQPTVATLKQVFDAAWERQPEARAAGARRDAAQARREAARSAFAEPPSAELSAKTDQITGNDGSREYEATIAMPLWLPGERGRTQALAEAESGAVDARILAAQLRTAGAVREAYWGLQRAHVDVELAQARLANAERLARDVARRVKAGDLARADQHQAESAAAAADALAAEARGSLAQAAQQLRALAGRPVSVPRDGAAEVLPPADASDAHPALRELAQRAEVARRARDLGAVQKRANPEVRVGTSRERGALGESYNNLLVVGVRLPFGSDSRSRARTAAAAADEIEAETELTLERERLIAAADAANARLDAVRMQVAAAERRAVLARETRGFFEKSFALGESDLPTRLRVELEAFEAERQAARSRVEQAHAVSQLRQALGYMPQ